MLTGDEMNWLKMNCEIKKNWNVEILEQNLNKQKKRPKKLAN